MTALPASLDLLLMEPDAATHASVEQQKICAAQAGDMVAFEWIVQQHEERLYGFCCRWLRCTEDAREVCQDAFVRAWQALPEFEGRARLSTWLYQIALNLCRDRAKTRASRQRENTIALDDVTQTPECPKQGPADNAEWQSELQKLERGLTLLPEKLRAALMLTTMEGLSQEECAEVLSTSVRSVEGRIYRARQMLMQWWEEEG
jgi:RNA polymerase sigma factor (sigma-70 family)